MKGRKSNSKEGALGTGFTKGNFSIAKQRLCFCSQAAKDSTVEEDIRRHVMDLD